MPPDVSLSEAQRLVSASRPTRSYPLVHALAILTALGLLAWTAIVGESYFGSPWLALAVPWLIVMTMLLWRWGRLRQQRRSMQTLARAAEAAEMNDWTGVLPHVRTVLAQAIRQQPIRTQALLLYAGAAERQRNFEVSEYVFEAILREHAGDAVQLHQATLGLAGTKLRSEQLTDAVTMLDRLRRVELPSILRAGVELMRLFQEVYMGHHDLALATMEQRRSLFRRYLSTRAAYGYALFAAALHGQGRADEAASCWRDATLLMRPHRLVERYDLLRVIDQHYPASEWPAL